MPNTPKNVEPAVAEVVRRSMTDPEFRNLALTDPNKALRLVDKGSVPESTPIRFIVEKPGYQTIVLPPPYSGIEEIADEELEQVAGGAQAADVTGTVGVKISW